MRAYLSHQGCQNISLLGTTTLLWPPPKRHLRLSPTIPCTSLETREKRQVKNWLVGLALAQLGKGGSWRAGSKFRGGNWARGLWARLVAISTWPVQCNWSKLDMEHQWECLTLVIMTGRLLAVLASGTRLWARNRTGCNLNLGLPM